MAIIQRKIMFQPQFPQVSRYLRIEFQGFQQVPTSPRKTWQPPRLALVAARGRPTSSGQSDPAIALHALRSAMRCCSSVFVNQKKNNMIENTWLFS
jgi:hypothetical protein